jgi:hypothetical protein
MPPQARGEEAGGQASDAGFEHPCREYSVWKILDPTSDRHR